MNADIPIRFLNFSDTDKNIDFHAILHLFKQ